MNPHFDADGLGLFEAELRRATCYAEYGSGGSTVFVDANSRIPCLSIETDPRWAHEVRRALKRADCVVRQLDLGPVGRWGRPKKLQKHMDEALRYPDSIFEDGNQPDLVLIDGRFRVGCFVQCYQRLRESAVILVDDFVPRAEYRPMSDLLVPTELAGRMAKFVVPPLRERRPVPLALAYRAALAVR